MGISDAAATGQICSVERQRSSSIGTQVNTRNSNVAVPGKANSNAEE